MAAHDTQLLKGILSMLLLQLLAETENYGYAVVEHLQAGGIDLKEGTVYPALTRLEKNGLLQSRLVPSASGPARKYYVATAAGKNELAEQQASWATLTKSVEQFSTPYEEPNTDRTITKRKVTA